MTRCQCGGPGWCERHGVQKTPHYHHLCQTREDYFQLWEQGRGPGQIRPDGAGQASKSPGWGDRLETTLTKMGITEERYVAVKAKFGLPPCCGCAARKAWLNKVEQWVKETIGIGK